MKKYKKAFYYMLHEDMIEYFYSKIDGYTNWQGIVTTTLRKSKKYSMIEICKNNVKHGINVYFKYL